MALSKKGSRKIMVDDHEFRWRATGNDGWISVVIWPAENDDCRIVSSIKYHNDWKKTDEGEYSSKSQIVVTNRMIRTIILHYGVHELLQHSGQINLTAIEDIYDVSQAVRSE